MFAAGNDARRRSPACSVWPGRVGQSLVEPLSTAATEAAGQIFPDAGQVDRGRRGRETTGSNLMNACLR